jgi:hypothetical protein
MRSHAAIPSSCELPATRSRRCRLCTMSIKTEDGDDVANGLCSGCTTTPGANELLRSPARSSAAIEAMVSPSAPTAVPVHAQHIGARAFNAADLSLIRRIGTNLAPPHLLAILNERLVADLGAQVPRYSLSQLQEAISRVHGVAAASTGHDWPSLRKLLARARRDGVLAAIDEQVINDFAVAFQLTTKQTLELKDIVLPNGLED